MGLEQPSGIQSRECHTEDSRTSLSAWAGLALDCGARRKYTSTSFAFGGLFVSKSCNIQEGVSSRHLGVWTRASEGISEGNMNWEFIKCGNNESCESGWDCLEAEVREWEEERFGIQLLWVTGSEKDHVKETGSAKAGDGSPARSSVRESKRSRWAL